MLSAVMAAYFSPALFRFLGELKANNTREWFEANRTRFGTDVEAPMRRFIEEIGPRLRTVGPSFVANPSRVGGSMFRIYRDTRFSSDKSPYKTNVAARFVHRRQGPGQSGPTFYLHLEPGDCFGGGGIYHPDTPTLTRIRLAMVSDARGWRAVRRRGLELEGESLARVPIGFDPSHPFAEDLRRKDLYALVAFTHREVCAGDFADRYVDACRTVAPLVAFLTRAVGWSW
jgi:uncharacterized protein (TIGR02453 family)